LGGFPEQNKLAWTFQQAAGFVNKLFCQSVAVSANEW
jgi:hypothetical protein